MSIARQVLFLRELGLSFRQIAKLIYKRSDSKSILKVYGIYKTYQKRYNDSKNNVITEKHVITHDNIVETIECYPLEKIFDDHIVFFAGDLAEERRKLARMLKYIDDYEKRKEIYRRLNKIKLIELVFAIYDLIGLSRHDRTRMYLSMLYSLAKKLIDRVDLTRDGVKRTQNNIMFLNEEASAFIYVVFFTTLYNTRYNYLLDHINEIIYSLISKRKRDKKIKRIREIIMKKYSDVLASTIVRF